MTKAEKIMVDALAKIHRLAKSWEGRKEAPYWNLGDIALSALINADKLFGNNWQPIETAPKDGTPILVYEPSLFNGRKVHLVQWVGDEWCLVETNSDGNGYIVVYDPTHWMPLPEPPEEHK